jgi:hypothetical protein
VHSTVVIYDLALSCLTDTYAHTHANIGITALANVAEDEEEETDHSVKEDFGMTPERQSSNST